MPKILVAVVLAALTLSRVQHHEGCRAGRQRRRRYRDRRGRRGPEQDVVVRPPRPAAGRPPSGDPGGDDRARIVASGKPRLGETLGPPEVGPLHQEPHRLVPASTRGAAAPAPRPSARSRAARSRIAPPATCGIRAAGVPLSGAVRKDVQPGQAAFVDQAQRVLEHRLGLGRKAGDEVGAEHHLRPRGPHRGAEGDRVVAAVPPLHPLQDHVVARLQRQVQVRHQPRLAGDRLDQPRVRLDLVDRGEPQPRQVRHAAKHLGRPGRRAAARPRCRRPSWSGRPRSAPPR